jgi:hypothetical protein
VRIVDKSRESLQLRFEKCEAVIICISITAVDPSVIESIFDNWRETVDARVEDNLIIDGRHDPGSGSAVHSRNVDVERNGRLIATEKSRSAVVKMRCPLVEVYVFWRVPFGKSVRVPNVLQNNACSGRKIIGAKGHGILL